jgi:hypothetical protein
MSLIEQIGIENVLNSILVNENVRPAMLVQPANYDEATGKDPKTKSIIEAVKKQFPTLLFSEDYKTYQGVIISKTDYTGQEISLERMGEILGYPCYQDFNAIDPTHISYSIDVYVKQKNTNEITYLFSNVCKDETNIEKFKSFADRAKLALNKKEYKDILNGIEIDKVGVEIEKIIPTQAIINKLIDNIQLQQDELDKIQNILFNFGFSMELQLYFLENFQYTNPIHKGILLSLLVNEVNDILSPFTPLQNYPEQKKNVYKIIEAWEKELIDVLERTKQNQPLQQNGNGNRNRKTRKMKQRTKPRRKLSSKKYFSKSTAN